MNNGVRHPEHFGGVGVAATRVKLSPTVAISEHVTGPWRHATTAVSISTRRRRRPFLPTDVVRRAYADACASLRSYLFAVRHRVRFVSRNRRRRRCRRTRIEIVHHGISTVRRDGAASPTPRPHAPLKIDRSRLAKSVCYRTQALLTNSYARHQTPMILYVFNKNLS